MSRDGADPSVVVDLVPFIHVTDVARSIRFYGELGYEVVKTHEVDGRLEFAGLTASSAAKLMLARVDAAGDWDPEYPSPGYLCMYTPDLDALRERLIAAGFDQDEIEPGPDPGPRRQLCVRDPDGYGHMVIELWDGSVASDPRDAAG